MIHYTLKCDNGHSFDSWFKSSAAFDALSASGHVSCAVCGSSDVGKAIMAPRVSTAETKGAHPTPPAGSQNAQVMTMPADAQMKRAISEFRAKVERESDYVGPRFAQEARAMHLGDAPERSIYGQATADEAKSLLSDGIPVLPLPFMPRQKTN